MPLDPRHHGRVPSAASFLIGACAWVVALAAAAVLAGWAVGAEELRTFGLGDTSTKLNTALAILACAISLVLQVSIRARGHGLARGLGAAAAVIGLLTLAEYALGLDVGLDELLVDDPAPAQYPGRMGPNTALAFVALGTALFLWNDGRGRRWRAWLATLGAGLGYVALVGYAAGIPPFYGVGELTRMTAPTAICIGLIGLGVILLEANWSGGPLAAPTRGGLLVRRLLPAALVLPLAIGPLRAAGENVGLFGREAGVFLFVLVLVLVLTALILALARSVDRSEGEREAGEEQVRLILETAHQAFISIDSGGRIVEWNPAAESTFGWPREEVLGKVLSENIISASGREAHERGLKRFLETGEGPVVGKPIELRALHRSGRELPVEIIMSPLEMPDGWHFNLFVQDISQREADAEALRQSEERFRALATQAPAGIYETSADGFCRFASERWCELAGLTHEEAAGTGWARTVHPDDKAEVFATWTELVESGRDFELEYRFLRPDETTVWVSGRGTAVRDSNGEVAGYVGTCLDITERRRVEAERMLRAEIASNMAEGVCLIRSRDSQIIYANSKFADMFGYAAGELEGKPADVLNAPIDSDPAVIAAEIQATLAAQGQWSGEMCNVHKDGTTFWCRANVSSFQHPEHGPVSVAAYTDITAARDANAALRRERRLLAEAQAVGQVGSWEWDLSTGEVGWSDEQYRLHGMTPGDPVPPPERFGELLHPDDRERVAAEITSVFAKPREFQVEYRRLHPDLQARTLLISGGPVGEAGSGASRLSGTCRDVTAEREAQASLREAEERSRSTFENAPIGMAVSDLKGRFEEVNPSLMAITGYSRDELVGASSSMITHPDDLETDLAAIRSMLAGDTSTDSVEKRFMHASGEAVWVAVHIALVRDRNGQPAHFLSQVQDVTERRRYEQRLKDLADHDPLTGLLNRRSLERELDRHASTVSRYGPQGAALVLDLDHFKYYNDTLGHHAGDELIVRVAKALRDRLRETDVLARMGGDEFAVILPREDADGAKRVAKDLLARIRQETASVAPGRPRSVSASIGVAMFTDEQGMSGEDVLVNADLAMYDAKKSGRDQISVHRSGDFDQARMKGTASALGSAPSTT